jgi:serine/threonine-protein kinase
MKTTPIHAGDRITEAVRLVRPLAEGGMGRVWIAEHAGLHTEVVVKLMAPEMAERPDGAERFAREAAIAAAIKSPHVVQVFDHGVTIGPDGQRTPYIVMELLEGRDLGAHLAEHGRMDPSAVVALVAQMAKALSKAHRAGIVHRDIKPDNIFLCDTEGGELFVKLLDFGTARREAPASSRTTVPGQIMGTPHYMSPEQSVGSFDIGERSDIWSLGVVVFEALTGQRPFDGSSVGAITIAIHGALPTMTGANAELPAAVDGWFARACAQAPEERFASVREAASALALALTGAPLVDQATETVYFPPPKNGGSTPVRPVTRPVEPLIASLPVRGSERRFTTIAAGLVMAASAVAMLAIVFGRSTPAASAPTAEATPPAQAAPPPVVPPAAAAPPPSVPEPAPVAAEVKKAATPAKRVKAPTPRAIPRSVRGAHRDAGATNADDDLVRLTNAANAATERPEAPVPKASAPTPEASPPLPPP